MERDSERGERERQRDQIVIEEGKEKAKKGDI